MKKKALVIGGPVLHAIGKIGTVISHNKSAYWIEFESITFEGVDPETQHANRSWFFEQELSFI